MLPFTEAQTTICVWFPTKSWLAQKIQRKKVSDPGSVQKQGNKVRHNECTSEKTQKLVLKMHVGFEFKCNPH